MFQRILVLISFALLPQMAYAHAHLKKSEPKQNSTVKKAPEKLVLSFSEALEATMSKIEIKDSKGNAVPSGPVTANSEDPKTIELALKDFPEGKETFEVSWKAVSKDTHKMTGKYKFTVDPNSK